MKSSYYSILINKYIIDKKTFFTLPYLKFIKGLYSHKEKEKKYMLEDYQIQKLINNIEDNFKFLARSKEIPVELSTIRKNLDNINNDLNLLMNNYEKEFGKTRETIIQRSVFEKSTNQLKDFIQDVTCYKNQQENFVVEKKDKYKDFDDYIKKNLTKDEYQIIKDLLEKNIIINKQKI